MGVTVVSSNTPGADDYLGAITSATALQSTSETDSQHIAFEVLKGLSKLSDGRASTQPLTAGQFNSAGASVTTSDPLFHYLYFYDASGHVSYEISGFSILRSAFITGMGIDAPNYDPDARYHFLVSLFNGDDHITGGTADEDFEVGTGGSATVSGGGGIDTLHVWQSKTSITYDGGASVDWVKFEALRGTTPDPVTGAIVNLTAGTGTNPYGGTLHLSSVENILGTSKNDSLVGNGADNRLEGGLGGNDVLRGEGGNDTLVVQSGLAGVHQTIIADGGAGNDTFVFDYSFYSSNPINILDLTTPAHDTGAFLGATITGFERFSLGDFANANAATDFRGTSIGEHVTGGWGNDSLQGNGGNDDLDGLDGVDTLRGGDGNDTLESALHTNFTNLSAGADSLDGGAGTDLAVMTRFASSQAFVLDLTNPNIVHTLVDGTHLISIERLDFSGGSGADRLTGGAFADSLSGGTGNDTLLGAAGNDSLTGSDGADSLNGGAGADTMSGGIGDDTYSVDSTSDQVVEANGGGTDRVLTSISLTLAANVENLSTTSATGTAAINLTGNGLGNTITGNAGANVLNGGAGADTMAGGAGNDFYAVDNTGDKIIEAAGAAGGVDKVLTAISFTLTVNIENLATTSPAGTTAINLTGNILGNTITGNAGANVIMGADGADILTGGAGRDTLAGNVGLVPDDGDKDTYVFNAVTDSGTTAATRDIVIGHFNGGAAGGDKVDLSAIDADSTLAGNQAFVFDTAIGTATSAVARGHIGWYQEDNAGTASDHTIVKLNIDADSTIESTIQINGLVTLHAADFVL